MHGVIFDIQHRLLHGYLNLSHSWPICKAALSGHYWILNFVHAHSTQNKCPPPPPKYGMHFRLFVPAESIWIQSGCLCTNRSKIVPPEGTLWTWTCAQRADAASSQWRRNERDDVSNHQSHNCLLNHLFRRSSKKTSNSASLAFVRGMHRSPVNFPHKRPVTRKMFPFDDAMMCYKKLHLKIGSLDWIKSCSDTKMSLWRRFHI